MKASKVVAASVVAAGVVMGASACNTGPACVSGHYNYIPVPVYNGKTTVITIMPIWECDSYATSSKEGK